MDLNKIKLNTSGEEKQEAVCETESVEQTPADEAATGMPAAEEEAYADEEMPILIPEDYDVEDIDYSVRSTMSDVVAAKDGVKEVARYQRPKLKGKEAWENFFYHHKTGLIVAVVSIIMLAIIIIQSIPTKYDYYFNIYANVMMGVHSIEEIEQQLLEYAVDVDGNEEISINISSYNRNGMTDPYESVVAYMFIEMEFGGEFNSFLVVVDMDHYNFIVENVGEDIFEAYEGYPVLIPLKDSEFITSVSESNNNDAELYLTLVSVPERFKDDEDMVARHDAAKEMLGRILADHPELKKAESPAVSTADVPAA